MDPNAGLEREISYFLASLGWQLRISGQKHLQLYLNFLRCYHPPTPTQASP